MIAKPRTEPVRVVPGRTPAERAHRFRGSLGRFATGVAIVTFDGATRRHGITVNAIAPGVVDTDINAGYVAENPDLYAEVGKRLALGRVGKPRDLSSLVGFIASDEASWITGQVIYVDGGSLFQ